MKLSLVVGLSLTALAAACSSSDSQVVATPADASLPADQEDAGADGAVPAPRLSPPRVVSAGGPVLAAPKLLLVTFGDEPLQADLETYAKGIGGTSYWKDVASEYGVGPAVFARSVHIETPPVTITQAGVESWIVDQLDGTHPEWGTVDASTIVSVVYPRSTTVTVGGQSVCKGAPAWHSEVALKSKLAIPFAVIARCDPFAGLDGIDFLTAGLSHEWLEASTNPLWASKPAYNASTAEDAPWTVATGGELGDMCANTPTVYFKPEGFPFTVQRSWSNASAAAGHDPCVPRRKEPYFVATPAVFERIAAGGLIDADAVRGIVVPVGGSRTIDVALFSDGATAGPWTVKARDFAQRLGEKTDLTFTWDSSKGMGGETLHLTINRVKADEQLGGAGLFELISTLGDRQTVWVVAVGDAAR